MKLIFKTETEILKEFEMVEMTDEVEATLKELEANFDNRPILKYEITFKDGVFVKECHRLEDISQKIVSVLTITVI